MTDIMKVYLKGFKKGFLEFGKNISTITNTLILLIVYIFGVGLTSVIAKLSGKKFLDLKLNSRQTSYWTELNLKNEPKEQYYRQF